MFDAPMNRRQALRQIYRAIVAAGAASLVSWPELLSAAARGPEQKPDLVWLHASSCSGCSCSFLDIDLVPVVDIITRFANLVYHPDISLATGDQVTGLLTQVSKEKPGYLFILEGSIPVDLPHACLMGERPIREWVQELAAGASACIAAGTCAALGGITRMNGMVTGCQTLGEFMSQRRINKPLVNLPNCPMKPEHLVYTLLHQIKTGRPPKLDATQRPLRFFSHTNHERCVYYADFQEKHFATKIGEPGCLLKLGCQGPVTKNDCLITGHNGNTNTCIRAGHPCIGCASEHFPRQVMLHQFDDRRFVHKKF